jgi:hypothetical protein
LVDVSLKVRFGFVTSRELFVGSLKLLCVLDHLVDLGAGETSNGVSNAW